MEKGEAEKMLNFPIYRGGVGCGPGTRFVGLREIWAVG